LFSLVNLAVNTTLPAFAAQRRAVAQGCGADAAARLALSIDIFSMYGAQQQTHRTPLLRLTDRTD